MANKPGDKPVSDISEWGAAALFESAPVGLILVDFDGRVVRANSSAAAVFGCGPIELEGRLVSDFYPDLPFGLPLVMGLRRRWQAGETISDTECQICRADGRIRWIRLSTSPVTALGLGAVAALAVVADVTEEKATAEALQRSEEKFAAAFRSSPDAIFLTSIGDGQIIEASEAVGRLTGYPVEELVGRTTLGLGLWPNQDARDQMRAQMRSDGRIANYETQIRTKSGLVDVVMSGEIIQLEKGPVFLSIVRDIGEKKRAEEALRESEEKFSAIFRSSPDAFFLTSVIDGRIIEVNTTATLLTGHTAEEMLGRTTTELGLWADPAAREEYAARILREDRVAGFQTQIRTLPGTLIDVSISAQLFQLETGPCILSVARDITEAKRAEEALVASEAQLQGILANLQDAYFRADLSGRFILASPSAAHLYGYGSIEEMIGLPAETLYSDPQERAWIAAEMRESGRVRDRVGLGKKRDGTTFWVSMNAQFCRDDTGEIVGTEGFVRDISDRKQAEEAVRVQNLHLEEAHQELSDLVEAKDRFVATVSHELRTPLAVVLGFASELRDRAGAFSSSEVAEFASLISQGCAEANNLVEDLLVAARGRIGPIPLALEATDLQGEALAVMAEPESAFRLRFQAVEFAGVSAVAWADPQRVRQIMRNLLVNASRYGGPHISVVSGVCGDSSAVFCRVADDGPGVPGNLLDVLFLPYQSGVGDPGLTDSVGLGLHISHNLARAMGGDLTYRRDNGTSVFELTLPVSGREPPAVI